MRLTAAKREFKEETGSVPEGDLLHLGVARLIMIPALLARA